MQNDNLKLKIIFISAIFSAVLLLPKSSWAATYTCGTNGVDNSCTPAMMTTLITSASSGDTIQIATGIHSWTSMVTITKPLTISGGGTYAVDTNHNDTGTWPVQLDTQAGGNNCFLINVTSAGTGNVIITGIHFYGVFNGSYQTSTGGGGDGAVNEHNNNIATFRIHNNKFHCTNTSGYMATHIKTRSPYTYGLIDHNYFLSDYIDGKTLFITRVTAAEGNYDPQYSGTLAKSQDVDWGSANFTFIEDNTFIRPSAAPIFAPTHIDMAFGGKGVIRYNYFQNGFVTIHAMSGGAWTRSGHAYEIYNNTATYTHSTAYQCFAFHRSGSMLFHHNNVTGFQAWIKLTTPARAGNWGTVDGTKAWDENLTNGYPTGYRQVDQIGTGKAASGTFIRPNAPTIQPQEYKVSRVWHNTGSSSGGCSSPAGSSHSGNLCNSAYADYVVEDRDFYWSNDDSAAEPDYTPYTYPHPLQSAGTPPQDITPPAAPTGVTIS